MNNLAQYSRGYANYYPNIHHLSASSQIVTEVPSYSSYNLNLPKSNQSPSVGIATNPPKHREKFKQIVPRRKFTPEEDQQIKMLVEKLGTESWNMIAEFMPDRSARQCRDRYRNYLLDYLCQEPWTREEDQIIMTKFSKIGAHWVQIAKLLGRRSGNDVKNRWYKHLSKKYNQCMLEQHQTMTKQKKEENQKGKIKLPQQNSSNSLNVMLTSPHQHSNQTSKNDSLIEKKENSKCQDENPHLKLKNDSISDMKNHSLIVPKNNCCFGNSKTQGNNNITMNNNTQLKGIEFMNIFSNFDHELDFDQADYTSYIDNFFP